MTKFKMKRKMTLFEKALFFVLWPFVAPLLLALLAVVFIICWVLVPIAGTVSFEG